MKCLYCSKEIINGSDKELFWSWHQKCIKDFFGYDELPNLDLNEDNIIKIALDNSRQKYSITGVQKKLSLHLSANNKKTLTMIGYPNGYILKPQSKEYPLLPENEYMIMKMAEFVGIKTVPFALIKTSSDNYAYITKRIDRLGNKKLAMEDFCQLDLRLTEDKYKGSYERCGKIINKYSSQIMFDLSELFLRVVFSYLVGNSDMHLKNFSLICNDGIKYHLSEAYDLLSVKLVLNDNDDLALTLNGKKRNLRRNDFIKFGESIGLKKEACIKIINNLLKKVPSLIILCNESYLNDEFKQKFVLLLNKNSESLIE